MEVCYSDRWQWIFMITSRYEHMLDKSGLARQAPRSEPTQTESSTQADSANHKRYCTSTHEGSHGSFPD